MFRLQFVGCGPNSERDVKNSRISVIKLVNSFAPYILRKIMQSLHIINVHQVITAKIVSFTRVVNRDKIPTPKKLKTTFTQLYLEDRQCLAPLLLQNIQADRAVRVAIVYLHCEMTLRRLEREVWWTEYFQEENIPSVWSVFRTHDCRLQWHTHNPKKRQPLGRRGCPKHKQRKASFTKHTRACHWKMTSPSGQQSCWLAGPNPSPELPFESFSVPSQRGFLRAEDTTMQLTLRKCPRTTVKTPHLSNM